MYKLLILFLFYLLFTLLLPFQACKRNTKVIIDTIQNRSTPTSGELTFYVDESFKPLISATEIVFENTYRDAKLNINYSNEKDVINALLNRESPISITARKLKPEEFKIFNERGFEPQQLYFANDAIAFVINSSNPDSLLKFSEIKNILSGSITSWNKISNSSIGDIRIIFDKNNSSTASFILDSITHQDKLPSNCYAASSNDSVLNYVRKNKNSIGVIALNWVSDYEDPNVIKSLESLKVISISSKTDSLKYYKPLADNIAINKYPFRRYIYIINIEGRSGLGTGFASYLASDIGQTIIRQFELLPLNDPIRIVELKNKY